MLNLQYTHRFYSSTSCYSEQLQLCLQSIQLSCHHSLQPPIQQRKSKSNSSNSSSSMNYDDIISLSLLYKQMRMCRLKCKMRREKVSAFAANACVSMATTASAQPTHLLQH